MKFYKTILSLFLGYVSISQVSAESLTPPLKLRINSEVLRNVIHRRDQELLRMLTDISLTPGSGEEASQNRLDDLKASIVVQDGIKHDDFDLDLHMDKDYFGAETSQLQYKGSGSLFGKEFTFSGPVELMKLKYALKDKHNPQLGFDQLTFDESEFVFQLDNSKINISDADLTAEEKELILNRIVDRVTDRKDTASKGNVGNFKAFPLDTVLPFVALYYGASFADTYDVTEKFIELSFSFKRMQMLTEK